MPDPVAAQNLFDALKAFVALPTTFTWYSFAKDFQTLAAGVFALIAARAAYHGVMKGIAFDRETAENERKVALLARQRLQYGAFLRLQSEMRRLQTDASLILQKLKVPLSIAEGKADQIEIEWMDGLAFGDYDELEKAWKKIDLFPRSAIFLIDEVRSSLARAEHEGRYLTDQNANILLVSAKIYRDRCTDVERQAELLAKRLNELTGELAKTLRADP